MTHFQRLGECPIERQGAVGRGPADWCRTVGIDDEWGLATNSVDRAYLYRLAKQNIAPEKFFLSVMAWGAMRVDHGRSAWAVRKKWVPLVKLALDGTAHRSELYREFIEAKVSGLGPAFFTKLIHFAGHGTNAAIGYIMDQWTAKSVNLIASEEGGRPVVDVSAGGWVARTNDQHVYEAFCRKVDDLAQRLGVSGAQAEERLFSHGGWQPGAWRRYVAQHWKFDPSAKGAVSGRLPAGTLASRARAPKEEES